MVNYAIKFINPNGIDNLFIKVDRANRTEQVADLDPSVLKNGTYTWSVPFFSMGKESNDVNAKSKNHQMIQVGAGSGNTQLMIIKKYPDIYNLLAKEFFMPALRTKNSKHQTS